MHSMYQESIESLSDLNSYRSAPSLTKEQAKSLYKQLIKAMEKGEWFTLGIMAPSSETAQIVLRKIEKVFSWPPMKLIEAPEGAGSVFLKANQASNEIRVRLQEGLGEGVLISSHTSDPSQPGETWGPLPLNFVES